MKEYYELDERGAPTIVIDRPKVFVVKVTGLGDDCLLHETHTFVYNGKIMFPEHIEDFRDWWCMMNGEPEDATLEVFSYKDYDDYDYDSENFYEYLG